MKTSALVAQFLLGLLTAGFVAVFQPSPGYMDAEYYYSGSLQLVQGKGFSDPFLWNFLDDPQGIPHPSHAYWMPLASLVGLAGLVLNDIHSFQTARLGFILIAALVPPITAALAYELSHEKWKAYLAGALAAFSAFYLPFVATTDTFGIYMVLGGLFLLLIQRISSRVELSGSLRGGGYLWILCGILVGLMHLARADGFLWLLISILAVLVIVLRNYRSNRAVFFKVMSLILGGYLLVVGPWFVRNLVQIGSPLPSAGGKTLWLTNYDEFFSYPATILNFERWLGTGITPILETRLWALQINLQRALAEQGMIFLAPLIILGLWLERKVFTVRLGIIAWLMTFSVMTFVFPFSGARGGFFHSAAALQPLFWAVTPTGLDQLIQWGVYRRNWKSNRARTLFGLTAVGLAGLLSGFVLYSNVLDAGGSSMPWGSNEEFYRELNQEFSDLGIDQGEIVMVNNPPGYFVATGRPAIVIPDGEVSTSIAVAQRYHASYLILEENHPTGWKQVYQQPGDIDGWRYLTTFQGAHVFWLDAGD